MKTFMEWLVSETATIAQQLKASPNPNIPAIRDAVRNDLAGYEPFKKLGRDGDLLVNFMTKQVLDTNHPDTRGQSPRDPSWLVSSVVRPAMTKWGDFIFATWQHTKSRLNNPNYSEEQLDQDSDEWHEQIALKKSEMPSEEYEVFLDLQGSWKGWKWVSLGRGYCSAEAKAMGHCGNSGAREGDDILSLRDPEGKAHLTFIVNDGKLGEMKGRANSKPSKRYHPAILELLKHPEIHTIRGGGYAPERNFSLDDLDEAQRRQIESLKPDIGNSIMHMLKSGKKNELAAELGVEPNEISLEGSEVTLATFDDFEDLGEIVSGPAFGWWFGDDRDRHDGGGFDVSWSDAEDYADEELEDLMVKVAEQKGDKAEDAGEAFDNNDTVQSAISSAYQDAYTMGAENEASDSLRRLMDSPEDEYGFWVDMDKHPYALKISIEGLNRMGRLDDQEYRDLKHMINSKELFKFDDPSNGFYGFDKETFLDTAKESLKGELA
jgi:hypothetical protein